MEEVTFFHLYTYCSEIPCWPLNSFTLLQFEEKFYGSILNS